MIVAGDIAEYNASEVELKLASLLASISASHVNASAPQLLGIFPFVRYQVDVTITAQDDLFSSMAQHLLSAAHISSLSAALRLNITGIVGTTAARLAFAAPSPPPPVPPPSPLPSFPNPLPPPTPNPPLLPGGALKPTVTITISVDTTLADFDAATQSTFKIGLAAQFDDVDEDDVQLTRLRDGAERGGARDGQDEHPYPRGLPLASNCVSGVSFKGCRSSPLEMSCVERGPPEKMLAL